jgi:hypothetical protein
VRFLAARSSGYESGAYRAVAELHIGFTEKHSYLRDASGNGRHPMINYDARNLLEYYQALADIASRVYDRELKRTRYAASPTLDYGGHSYAI